MLIRRKVLETLTFQKKIVPFPTDEAHLYIIMGKRERESKFHLQRPISSEMHTTSFFQEQEQKIIYFIYINYKLYINILYSI